MARQTIRKTPEASRPPAAERPDVVSVVRRKSMPLDPAPLSGTVYIPDTSSLVENPDSLDRLLTDGVVLRRQAIDEPGGCR